MIYRREQPVRHSATTAFDWHGREGAIERLLPPWQNVRVVETTGGIAEPGSEVVLEMAIGPLRQQLRARHIDYQAGRSFSDELVEGPFLRWVHVHAVEPDGDAARLVDTVDFALPFGRAGRPARLAVIRRELERMFAFRQTRVGDDLDRHARYAARPRLRVGVTGQSGLIGTHLAAYLRTAGHEVVPLVRRPAKQNEISWGPRGGNPRSRRPRGPRRDRPPRRRERLPPLDKERKAAILGSRLAGLRLLRAAMTASADGPRTLLAASAIGWYGPDRLDEELDETSTPGGGFLAGVCRDSEAELQAASAEGIRAVPLRLGIVLHPRGGALQRLLPAARLGLTGPIGSGQGWWSWIDLKDVLAPSSTFLHSGLEGPVNVVSPMPVQQRTFARTLGRVLRRPSVLPLPAPAVKTMFGDMGLEVLLASQRVRPTRLEQDGFTYLHPQLEDALRAMLGHRPENANGARARSG